MPDEGNRPVSSLALAVLLLLVLVTLLLAGGIGYVVHRHPVLVAPITAAGTLVLQPHLA